MTIYVYDENMPHAKPSVKFICEAYMLYLSLIFSFYDHSQLYVELRVDVGM